ncbi:DUF3168 domain-containing protein [Ketogulonicigenium vulgare]|uniref:Putative gene transfer agent protein n=1 Tax=Ketogulonicigenium vulgare (strain WSH-001) TaxID=759362 RepID=F9Y459_KETVW|nr:DUF3168 domain-containing protein [Ketogulonicigenium vulgare]AEM40495.1 putative gene transfer agent protein [Ketogulonicigenium vulgare WSH-001]ALJ80680.1 hypothetical protein KVH_05495 [Ketogulonicigenium vulgare]ANW33488.1 hypothetical protein KvSKV_05465 [Ketogulonicigenium vulgare]AOZ54212.1 putative gene transfer agent protein [Ketogulonicigenium vulgare]
MTQSLALQQALYTRLTAALDGVDIYDALPSGPVPALYVALGPEEVEDLSTHEGALTIHEVKISVIATGGGFGSAKTITTAITEALAAPLTLPSFTASPAQFLRASAKGTSASGAERRIDLFFRIRIEP